MKSIQTKLILLIMIGILTVTIITGSIGISRFRSAMEEDCVQIMNLTGSEKAQELNTVFGKVEQAVDVISLAMLDSLKSIQDLSNDDDYLTEYVDKMDKLSEVIADETEGSIAVYIRLNPDIAGPVAGFFKIRTSQDRSFANTELTDLSLYDKSEYERVGWYYEPIEAGKPIWMMPYYNKNINIKMISYVVPVYVGDVLLGVVGMDIDFGYITGLCDEIHCYETGHAFLVDENLNISYSRHFDEGMSIGSLGGELYKDSSANGISMETLYSFKSDGEKMNVTFSELGNGMYLAVVAPVAEVSYMPDKLVIETTAVAFIVALIFIVITSSISRSIVKPLRELDMAAKEIAKGNLDISVSCNSRDEVGTLAESIRETADQLKVKIDYINNLAFMDKLTSIKSNNAYHQEYSIAAGELRQGILDSCSLFIIDVNGLKSINDTYGHAYGNKLLISVSKAMVRTFGFENTYRVGGDEFMAILRKVDEGKCREFEAEFKRITSEPIDGVLVSAAVGFASFNSETDRSLEDVFRRADAEMYKNKIEMKKSDETSSIMNDV